MVSPIKVLHVIGGGEFGGAEQHILALMKGFKESPIQAEVVTFYDALFTKKLREMDVPVTVLHPSSRFDYRLHQALLTILKNKKPDIVHTHGVRANFFGRIASKKAKISHVVTTIHSFLQHDYPNRLSFLIANQMEKQTRYINNHFVVVSEALKSQLVVEGIAESKITKIYNGINIELYQPTEALKKAGKALHKEWNIPDDAFVLGTTARIVAIKGLDFLIKGFAQALQTEPNLMLVIIGDGPERAALTQLVDQLQIGDRIRFVGFRYDIPACLAALDLYLNTSLSEGQSISLLEAMAAEKPAIVTEVGGMKEMVVNGENGILIPPASPEAITKEILRLRRNPQECMRMSNEAKRIVEEHYSVKVMLEQQINLYRTMIKGT